MAPKRSGFYLCHAFLSQGYRSQIGAVVAVTILLSGCTRGHLDYVTPQGEHKTGCATEYSWAPAVDKHAVDYVLAYCAKGAAAQGHQIKEQRLLQLDLTIPPAPQGQRWSHELAAAQHKVGQITDQQYGYIVAYLDLGLDQPQAKSQEP
jgi:hypothetical protein